MLSNTNDGCLSAVQPAEDGDVDDYMHVLAAETARKQAKQLTKERIAFVQQLKDLEQFLQAVKPDFEAVGAKPAAPTAGDHADVSNADDAVAEPDAKTLLLDAKREYAAKQERKQAAKQLLAGDDEDEDEPVSRLARLKQAVAAEPEVAVPEAKASKAPDAAKEVDPAVATAKRAIELGARPVPKRPKVGVRCGCIAWVVLTMGVAKAHPAIAQAVGARKPEPEGFGTEAYQVQAGLGS